MRIWARYELVIRDKHGRVVSRVRRRSRSYVIAMTDLLSVQVSKVTRSIVDILGATRSIIFDSGNFEMTGFSSAFGAASYGPVVGTGTTVVAITNTKLAAQIAHGSNPGQLTHYTPVFSAPATSGSTRSFTAQRVFVNNSGATITIAECGLYCTGRYTAAYANLCLVRDLVSPAQDVPSLGSATLTYTLGVTA